MQWSQEQLEVIENARFDHEPGGFDVHQVDLVLETILTSMRAGAMVPDPAQFQLRRDPREGYARAPVQELLQQVARWRAAARPPTPGAPPSATPRALRWTQEQVSWITGHEFPRVRGGYEQTEVDDFLDSVVVELRHGRRMPDIAGAQFTRRRLGRGYDVGAVDEFLDRLMKIRPAP